MLKKSLKILLVCLLTVGIFSYGNLKTVKAEAGYTLSQRVALNNLFSNMDDLFGVGNSGRSVGFMEATLPNGKTWDAYCIDPAHLAVPGSHYDGYFWNNYSGEFKNEEARRVALDYYYNYRHDGLWGSSAGYYAVQMVLWAKIRGTNPADLTIRTVGENFSQEQADLAARVKTLAVKLYNGNGTAPHGIEYKYNNTAMPGNVDLSNYDHIYYHDGKPYYRSKLNGIVTTGTAGELKFTVSVDNGFVTNSNNYGWSTSMNFGEGTDNGTGYYIWLPALKAEGSSSEKNIATVRITNGSYEYVDAMIWVDNTTHSQTLLSLALNSNGFSRTVTFEGKALEEKIVYVKADTMASLKVIEKGYKMTENGTENTEYGELVKYKIDEADISGGNYATYDWQGNEEGSKLLGTVTQSPALSQEFVMPEDKLSGGTGYPSVYVCQITPAKGHNEMTKYATVANPTPKTDFKDSTYQCFLTSYNINKEPSSVTEYDYCELNNIQTCSYAPECTATKGENSAECRVDKKCYDALENKNNWESCLKTEGTCPIQNTCMRSIKHYTKEVTVYNDIKKFTINVTKTDANEQPMKDADVALYLVSGSREKLVGLAKTDNNGKVSFVAEDLGLMTTYNYIVREVDNTNEITYTYNDKDYDKNSKVTIRTMQQTENDKTYEVKITEHEKTGNYKITKKDSKTSALMSNVDFSLEQKNGLAVYTATTDENGVALFENIPLGTYILKEDKVVGYKAIADKEVTLVNANETVSTEILNTPEDIKPYVADEIEVKKTVTGTSLKDVFTFNLINNANPLDKYVIDVTAGQTGKIKNKVQGIIFNEVGTWNYTLTEQKADGYEENTQSYKLTFVIDKKDNALYAKKILVNDVEVSKLNPFEFTNKKTVPSIEFVIKVKDSFVIGDEPMNDDLAKALGPVNFKENVNETNILGNDTSEEIKYTFTYEDVGTKTIEVNETKGSNAQISYGITGLKKTANIKIVETAEGLHVEAEDNPGVPITSLEFEFINRFVYLPAQVKFDINKVISGDKPKTAVPFTFTVTEKTTAKTYTLTANGGSKVTFADSFDVGDYTFVVKEKDLSDLTAYKDYTFDGTKDEYTISVSVVKDGVTEKAVIKDIKKNGKSIGTTGAITFTNKYKASSEPTKPQTDEEKCKAKGSGYYWDSKTKKCTTKYVPTKTGIK